MQTFLALFLMAPMLTMMIATPIKKDIKEWITDIEKDLKDIKNVIEDHPKKHPKNLEEVDEIECEKNSNLRMCYNRGGDGIIEKDKKRSVTNSEDERWIKKLPYIIIESDFQAGEIEFIKKSITAMNAQMGAGCFQLVPRTNQGDYVEVVKRDGCWSELGKLGDVQQLSLGDGCLSKATIQHEFLHAMGFYHEQNRPDRDNFVNIKLGNVREDRKPQFEKQGDSLTFNQAYDYRSVMHYHKTAFTKNEEDTIVPKTAGVHLGNEKGMTPQDIKDVREMYKCSGSCQSNSDCSGNRVCKLGICMFEDPGCSSDDDCGNNETCYQGGCSYRQAECSSDNECGEFEYCSDGTCFYDDGGF